MMDDKQIDRIIAAIDRNTRARIELEALKADVSNCDPQPSYHYRVLLAQLFPEKEDGK